MASAADDTADAHPAEHGLDTAALVRRAVLLVVLAVVVVAALVWLPALEPVRDRLRRTQPGWVAAAALLQLASALSFVAAFRGAFERRIGWRAAFDLAVVEQGANVVLPTGGSGGLALGAVFLVRAGVPTRYAGDRTAVLFLTTSAVSFAAVVVAGLGEAVGIFPGSASLAATLLPAVGAALIMLAVLTLPHRVPMIEAHSGQRVRGAVRSTQAFLRRSVSATKGAIAAGDPLLIGGSIGYFAFDVASLAAAFHGLGGALPLGTFVLAYVLGHAGALLPVPGSAEGGLVGAFTGYGSSLSVAVGAILVYRTFHAGLPVLLGLVGYLDIRRLRRVGAPPEEIARRFSGA